MNVQCCSLVGRLSPHANRKAWVVRENNTRKRGFHLHSQLFVGYCTYSLCNIELLFYCAWLDNHFSTDKRWSYIEYHSCDPYLCQLQMDSSLTSSTRTLETGGQVRAPLPYHTLLLQPSPHLTVLLFPITTHTQTHTHTGHISLGALGDSFYEYLLKSWLMTSKVDTEARDMNYDAISDSDGRLLLPSSVPLSPPLPFLPPLPLPRPFLFPSFLRFSSSLLPPFILTSFLPPSHHRQWKSSCFKRQAPVWHLLQM